MQPIIIQYSNANRKFVATEKYTILWTAIVKRPDQFLMNDGFDYFSFLAFLALKNLSSIEMFVVIGVNTSRFAAQY